MAQGYEVRSHTYMSTAVLVLARTGASGFDFTAHGGKTGKILPSIIKRGRELAAIAKECVEEAD